MGGHPDVLGGPSVVKGPQSWKREMEEREPRRGGLGLMLLALKIGKESPTPRTAVNF